MVKSRSFKKQICNVCNIFCLLTTLFLSLIFEFNGLYFLILIKIKTDYINRFEHRVYKTLKFDSDNDM